MAQQLSQQELAAMDSAFYSAAVRRSVKLPKFAVSSGGTYDVTLPKAGIGTYALLAFRGTLSRTEGATVGKVNTSPNGPWNVIQNESFTDYNGIVRHSSLSGSLLNFRRRMLSAPRFDTQDTTSGAPNGELASVSMYNYSIPAGTASSTTTSPLNFSLLIPFSAGYNNVKGSYAFTEPNGSSTLSFTIQPEVSAPASGNPDPKNIALITAGSGSTVTVSGNVYITYYYYDVPAGTPMPLGELSQVFELVNVTDSSNLTAGNTKSFVLQTGRTYIRAYQSLVLNGLLQTSAVDVINFKVNASTPTTDEYIYNYLDRMAQHYGQPPVDGRFILDWSGQPWTPDSYGSLEVNLEIDSAANVSAPAYLDTTRECLYVSSQSVSLVQAGSAG